MALWGGRFESGPHALFTAPYDSLPFDYRLRCTTSPARSAGRRRSIAAGVLTSDELTRRARCAQRASREARRRPTCAPRNARRRARLPQRPPRRGHPLLGRTPSYRAKGRPAGQEAVRPQPQRPGRDGPAPMDTRRDRRDPGPHHHCRACAIRALRRACDGDSGYTHLQRAQRSFLRTGHWPMSRRRTAIRQRLPPRERRGARVNIVPRFGALAGTGATRSIV